MLINGFITITLNCFVIIMCKKFLLSKEEGISKIQSSFLEKMMKLALILGTVLFITNVIGEMLIDISMISIDGEAVFYNGEVSEIILMHEQKVDRKLYNITLNVEGESVLFEDIRVGDGANIKKGDTIEICYNPAMEGIVSKVNGKETYLYKYEYSQYTYPTVWHRVQVGIVFVVNFIIHAMLYRKECKKENSNKRQNLFRNMWKYGGIAVSILLILSLLKIIDYYLIRKLIQCVYYVFATGEFFYILDVGGFKWVTTKEEISISEDKN